MQGDDPLFVADDGAEPLGGVVYLCPVEAALRMGGGLTPTSFVAQMMLPE